MGSDPQIVVSDPLSSALEVCAYRSVGIRNGLIKREHGEKTPQFL